MAKDHPQRYDNSYAADVAYVENFQANWEARAKDEPLKLTHVETGETLGYQIATQVNNLQVISRIEIGKRGGLIEHVTAVDPTQTITLDRLVLYKRYKSNSGTLLDMDGLREEIKEGADRDKACLKHLDDLLKRIHDNPNQIEQQIKDAKLEPGGSINYTFGGGWSRNS